MAEPIINVLGTVAIKTRGEYDASTNYEKLNVVTYQGSSYCAKTATQGNLPTNTTYWDLIAEKGDKGDTGESGYTPVKGTDYYTTADINALEATLSADVSDEVSNQLEDLTSATPLVASSSAEMTDTTRIYVNTTDGHWYWHDGEDWVDGGVYQAAEDSKRVKSNTADTEKSSKNYYYYLKNIVFEQGGINTTSGEDEDSSIRIRTKGFIPTEHLKYAVVDNAKKMACVYYDKDLNKVATSNSWYTPMGPSYFSTYPYVRFMIKNSDESAITPSMANTFGIETDVNIDKFSDLNNKVMNLYTNKTVNIIDYIDIEYGGFAIQNYHKNGTDTRLRNKDYIDISKIKTLKATCDEGYEIRLFYYNENLTGATYSGWHQNTVITSSYGKYFNFTIMNTNNSDAPMSLSEINHVKITYELSDDNIDYGNELPILGVVNENTSLASDTTTCIMHGRLVIPYPTSAEYTIKCSNEYKIAPLGYDNLGNATYNSSKTYSVNGSTFSFSNTTTTYRIAIKKVSGDTISASDIKTLISSGDIKIYTEDFKDSIINDNKQNENYIRAALTTIHKNSNNTNSTGNFDLPVIIHATDVHGDAQRLKRLYEYSKYIGASEIINTGDTIPVQYGANQAAFAYELADKYNIPTIITVGNHDASGATEANKYTEYIEPYATKFGYTTDNVSYYFYDNVGDKIRWVVLDNYANKFNQLSWLKSVLENVPQDFGVIISTHQPFVDYNDITQINPNFFDNEYKDYWDKIDYPFVQIIDAFINKEQITFTYSGSTYEYDFTNLNENVEFLFYVFGHTHNDVIGYIGEAQNTQLVLNSTCVRCDYGEAGNTSNRTYAAFGMLPRGFESTTQDAFNMYVIDREHGVVKIARIGSNFTIDGIERKFMIANYKNTQ